MLIGRVARGGSQEPDLGGDKRGTNKYDVILNPYHCKILARLLVGLSLLSFPETFCVSLYCPLAVNNYVFRIT